MLKIKLVRIGKKNQPQYRIVVDEARTKNGGAFVDHIGHFNPLTSSDNLKLDMVKYTSWLKKGAQPTDTVRNLIKKLSKSSKRTTKPTKSTTKKSKSK